MKLYSLLTITALGIILSAFSTSSPEIAPANQTTLKWYTWQQAVEMQKTAPKKVMVDMYTDWCGWCKRMDATTFSDPKVIAYLQENFYPVKFDAEQKDEVIFNQYTFKYLAPEGGQGRGVHELAYSLLEGKLGYPSIVYLTPNYERVLISPGYKDVEGMMKELSFVKEDIYKSKTFEDYKAGK